MYKSRIKTTVLQVAVKALKAMVNEAKFTISQDGIETKAIDSANVAMVDFRLGKEAFEDYEATEGELAMNINKLADVMEMASKDGFIELELDESQHKIHVRMGDIQYKLSLLDPTQFKPPKLPSIDQHLHARITIKSEDFKRGIKASEKIGDYVALGVKDAKTFFLLCEGDTDKVELELRENECISFEMLDGKKDAKSLYSIEYLSDIQKAAGAESEVSIALGTNYPVKIGFKFADGNGEVGYIIAPRVESE